MFGWVVSEVQDEMHLRDVTKQLVLSCAAFPLARGVHLLVTLVAPVARRPRAFLVIAFVDLGVGISKLDGNVSDEFVLEPNSLHTGNGLDDSRLSVSDVTDCADVDRSLTRNNLGCQRAEGLDIEVFGLCLGGKVWSLDGGSRRIPLHGGLEGLLMLVIGDLIVKLRFIAGVRLRLDVVAELVAVGRHDEGWWMMNRSRRGRKFLTPPRIRDR